MRKILALVVVAVALVACKETTGEKVERKLRNAGDDIEDAVDDLK